MRFREITPLPEYRQPVDRNEEFTVVRTGNIIVTLQKLDVGAASSFPIDLISKQVERLRNAQRL
ncbi:hypothetical protein ACH492_28325 [Streptomyces sp. NPDC019443]|uniref:hypothetical protein n=1 Tax=Streptomyces sp. NPDC019443 TaxID=3365061 RepID=UPI0037A2D2CD